MTTGQSIGQLFETLKRSKTTSIITHNNPDPDALASALGLRFLLKKEGFKRVRIFYNGSIGERTQHDRRSSDRHRLHER